MTTTGGRLNIGTAMARMPADTSITSGPGEGEEIGTPTAAFGVASNDPAAGFQCSLDGAAYETCGIGGTASIGPLAPGGHSLLVRSVDPRGNADTTPATRTFAVESDPPETTIDRGPKKRTAKKKAKFKFSSDEPGSTFECKVDRKRFARVLLTAEAEEAERREAQVPRPRDRRGRERRPDRRPEELAGEAEAPLGVRPCGRG